MSNTATPSADINTTSPSVLIRVALFELPCEPRIKEGLMAIAKTLPRRNSLGSPFIDECGPTLARDLITEALLDNANRYLMSYARVSKAREMLSKFLIDDIATDCLPDSLKDIQLKIKRVSGVLIKVIEQHRLLTTEQMQNVVVALYYLTAETYSAHVELQKLGLELLQGAGVSREWTAFLRKAFRDSDLLLTN